MRRAALVFLVLTCAASSRENLAERARRYLSALVRLDTSNPPGRESRAAGWIASVARGEGIDCELLGPDPARLNVVARLKAPAPRRRPLLLMAHSDVVPAPRAGWSAAPFSANIRNGHLYGRGALDAKSLLAAELAVLVELRGEVHQLGRDVILLSEADEEEGSSGITWLLQNAWPKIDAEYALGEGGFAVDLPSGVRVYEVQTAEKAPLRVVLRAHGPGGHGSLPQPGNPLVRLSRAVSRIADAEQPVMLSDTTRRHFAAMARLPEYSWLSPLLPSLDRPATVARAAAEIRSRDPEFDAELRTTVSPDVFRAGTVVNAIPATAEAQLDIRLIPGDTADAVLARLRRVIADSEVEISIAPGRRIPATRPSPTDTPLYRAMEAALRQARPKSAVVPYLQRGATDGAWLRQKGVIVYGVPLFVDTDRDNRAHAVDERISLAAFDEGVRRLLDIVEAAAK